MRQQSKPLILSADKKHVVETISLDGNIISEKKLQKILHEHPQCLPISEIDHIFENPVAICRELCTDAGPIDNFYLTPNGLPILVECKLWRNPEGRRKVIGQILDYAKEISQWTASDVQRVVNQNLKMTGNSLVQIINSAGHDIDEISFIDNLTKNLQKGRFLLLIVGDGIRASMESIAEYVQRHSGLHFTLGLVEMPLYQMDDGRMIIVPRILAKTSNIIRTVIETPQGYQVTEDDDIYHGDDDLDPDIVARRKKHSDLRLKFWTDFLADFELNDPEQEMPSPSRNGYVRFFMDGTDRTAWVSVYRSVSEPCVGIFLSARKNSMGEEILKALEEEKDEIYTELGQDVTLNFGEGTPQIIQIYPMTDLENPEEREASITWLRERTNAFINCFRPRIRTIAREVRE